MIKNLRNLSNGKVNTLSFLSIGVSGKMCVCVGGDEGVKGV